MAAGALVVDTRSEHQRRRDGELPGAVVIERNVLEWRLDPTSPHRLEGMDDPARPVVVVCDEGYASSLAAAGLRALGLLDVTDLAGGFQAWRAAHPDRGEPEPGPERRRARPRPSGGSVGEHGGGAERHALDEV